MMSDDTRTVIDCTYGKVAVSNNYRDSDHPKRELYLSVEMAAGGIPAETGYAYIGVSADEMLGAIDKAVGKRLTLEPAVKPYRPQDRDRLLRHIEDIEASLTRRNERWEKDQERIRALSAEVSDLQTQIAELCMTKTAREHLELAWEQAIVPEDGMIREGEAILVKDEAGIRQAAQESRSTFRANVWDRERRLLDPRPKPTREDVIAGLRALERKRGKFEVVLEEPRMNSNPDGGIATGMVKRVLCDHLGFEFEFVDPKPNRYAMASVVADLGVTAEDFVPAADAYRKELEAKGLADWEVELLVGSAES